MDTEQYISSEALKAAVCLDPPVTSDDIQKLTRRDIAAYLGVTDEQFIEAQFQGVKRVQAVLKPFRTEVLDEKRSFILSQIETK